MRSSPGNKDLLKIDFFSKRCEKMQLLRPSQTNKNEATVFIVIYSTNVILWQRFITS